VICPKVFEWSLANSLNLNPLKSMVLPVYRNHLLGPLPALFLADDFIPYVFQAKILGVTLSYDLNWGDHVISRKVYGALAGLKRLADAVRMRLVVALVILFFHLLRLCLFRTRFLFAKKTYGSVQCLCQVCVS
jgi:hypothetical protein